MLNLLPITWQARVLIVLVLTLAALASGFVGGLRYESNKRDSAELVLLQNQDKLALAFAKKANTISAGYETRREKTKVVYQTITQEVTKYVETHPDVRNCGLDADGLRLWNAANAGALPDPGKPDGGLSGTAASGVRSAP